MPTNLTSTYLTPTNHTSRKKHSTPQKTVMWNETFVAKLSVIKTLLL